jgi:hypothetical protein
MEEYPNPPFTDEERDDLINDIMLWKRTTDPRQNEDERTRLMWLTDEELLDEFYRIGGD